MGRSNPRHYSGTGPTAHSLSSIAENWLQGLRLSVRDRPGNAQLAWNRVVGSRIGSEAQFQTFEGGVLTICVANSTLLSLLAGPERARILYELKQKHRLPVKAIRFIRG